MSESVGDQFLDVNYVLIETDESKAWKVESSRDLGEPVELNYETGQDPGQNDEARVTIVHVGNQDWAESADPQTNKGWILRDELLGLGELLKVILDDFGWLILIWLLSELLQGLLKRLVAAFHVDKVLTGDQDEAEEQYMGNLLYNNLWSFRQLYKYLYLIA